MKNELDQLGKVKQILHGGQSVLIFIAWALSLTVLTKDGQQGVQIQFYFALTFLSVPALIYLVLVPVFPRARRFVNVYAYATLDILLAILWFSASIAVAAWNSAGLNQGKSDSQDSDGSCNYFAYGSFTKCTVSKASVGFGILLFFLFGASAVVSVLFCIRYRRTGIMPGLAHDGPAMKTADETAKDVWSSSIEEREANDYDEIDESHKYGQILDADQEDLLHHKGSSYTMQIPTEAHPGSQLLHQISRQGRVAADQYDDQVPSALSPVGDDEMDASMMYGAPPSQYKRLKYGRADYHVAPYPVALYERKCH